MKNNSKNKINRVKKVESKKSFYKSNNFFVILSLIVVAIYFASNLIISLRNKEIETEIINFGKVESIVEKEMVIARNDKVLLAPETGYYELIYPEGERVKKGLAVAKTKSNELFANYNYLIEILDTRIKNYDQNKDLDVKQNEVNKINNRLEQLYKTAQNRIQNGEIEYIDNIKKEIISLNDEKQYFFSNDKLIPKEELIAQKEKLIAEKNSKNSIVYSPQVGLVSLYYDGLEEKFNTGNIKNLNVSDLENIKNVQSINYINEIKKGEPLVVISENFTWYLLCEVFEKDIDSIASERPMYIEIGDKRFRAYLEDFFKGSDDKFLGYFRVEDEKFSYYEKRKLNAKIILQSSDGLAIPNAAIVEKDGKKGVYVVERTGVVYFKELLEISAENKQYTGIKYDPSKQNLKGVVKLYDEVILNPIGIKEGQKVR